MTFHIESKHLAIVKNIISHFPYTFYVYSSRTKGTHKKFSDIDLCVMQNIDISTLGNIKEAFDESDLPMKVDVVIWPQLSEDFQQLIKNDLILITYNEQHS